MKSTRGEDRSLARAIGAFVAFSGVALLGLVGGLWWNLLRPLPPDAELERRFREHREELDTLVAMAVADTQLVGVGHDPLLMRFVVFVHDSPRFNRMLSDGEVRATGRSEYRRRMGRAGVPALSRARGGDAVWFVVRSRIGVRKGYVYSEKPLAPLRSSLDGLERASAGSSGYVALAPRWFLFLEPSD